ncbi:MAG: endonuclease/exonuclease/phosphatase family protein [Suipraeoptans sp.]
MGIKLKKALKGVLILVLAILVFIIGVLVYLAVTEYKPEDEEILENIKGEKAVSIDDTYTIMSYNIGYAGLGENEDFFMDDGDMVRPDNSEIVMNNLEGVASEMASVDADFYLTQELDLDSKRSYNINQQNYLRDTLNMDSAFAYNFNCNYVPYPIPTIGKVKSGLSTFAEYSTTQASRISLPIPFSWPVRMANLKRCILETRFEIEGSNKELVILNVHLEAYDDGEGKKEQTKILMNLLEEEYSKGNYVIAGGDFNQTLQDSLDMYPIKDENNWMPGIFDEKALPKGFRMFMDTTTPTCRLNDAPLSEDTQVYVIDGYIVSPNINVGSVSTINAGFKYTDHNPVVLSFGFEE